MNKEIRLTNNCGTVILVAAIKTATDISERADSFYQNIADAFERYVRETLYKEAGATYDASSDRRKRYRFVPFTASLCCKSCEEGIVEVCVKRQEAVLLHERHIWELGLLRKREYIKRP